MGLYYFLIIYILMFSVLIFGKKSSLNRNKIYLILTFGLFGIIGALRGVTVGNDTLEYLNIYNRIRETGDIYALTWRYEIGYLYLNKVLGLFFSNQQAIIVLTSALIMFGYAKFIDKYSRCVWMSVYLFFVFRFFDMSMVVVRLNIAIVFILFSYDFLRQRKLIKFVVLVLIASLFHRTAIVFLISWPITKLKFNYKTIIFMLIGSLILYGSFELVFNILLKIFPTYSYYLDSSYLNGEVRLASIINLLISFIISLFGLILHYQSINKKKLYKSDYYKNNKLEKFEKNINDNEIMALVIVSGAAINIWALRFNLFDRVSTYFQVFCIVYLPNIIIKIKNKKLVVLILFVVMVMFLLYSISINIMRPEWNGIYPYSFFWEN